MCLPKVSDKVLNLSIIYTGSYRQNGQYLMPPLGLDRYWSSGYQYRYFSQLILLVIPILIADNRYQFANISVTVSVSAKYISQPSITNTQLCRAIHLDTILNLNVLKVNIC